MNPQDLADRIHALNGFKHCVTYYGPSSQEELLAVINQEHRVPETLKDIPAGKNFEQPLTTETQIFIAPYEAKQVYMAQFSNKGEKYNPAIEADRTLYNEYFGGAMNSIVFQEMRESRSLAYSAGASFSRPSRLPDPYAMGTIIATQNDKLTDAIRAFDEIINDMPQSETAFRLAKESLISRLRTERIIKDEVIWSYINAQRLGENTDSRIRIYQGLQDATLQDVVNFQQQWIKGRTYKYCILGDKKELDMTALKKLGPVKELTTEEIFGY